LKNKVQVVSVLTKEKEELTAKLEKLTEREKELSQKVNRYESEIKN
jgi:cell division protein FtsB